MYWAICDTLVLILGPRIEGVESPALPGPGEVAGWILDYGGGSYGGECIVWRGVYGMAGSVSYGGECIVWRGVYHMAGSVWYGWYGGECMVWRGHAV